MIKQDFELYKKADGGLYLFRFGREEEVVIIASFPWSHPKEYLSLKNKEGLELLFIENRAELCAAHRELIDEQLDRRGFVLEICKVFAIDDEIELRRFDVETTSGSRSFYTKLEDWPELKSDGSILIHDIYGDLYQIVDWTSLDRKSREEISVLVA